MEPQSRPRRTSSRRRRGARLESDILLIANGISSDAKDSAAVAALQVHGGTSAQVLATGPDEEAALQALLPVLQAR